MQSIIAFFMSIIIFIANLFGITYGVNTQKNVAYGSESQSQKVDIYLPKKAPENVGLIFFIHGGAWAYGDKDEGKDACVNIARYYKYAASSMNYRMLDEKATYAEMLEDIDACLNTVKETAAQKGVNITSCALVGTSAGAHLAMLYSYKCGENSPIPIRFVADISGPTNLADENFYRDPGLARFLGGVIGAEDMTAENYKLYFPALAAASPLTYAAKAVPTIICHGDSDKTVPYSNALSLDSALTALGIEHKLITYVGADHDLAGDEQAADEYGATLESWAKTYFGY
ncbi:MAG: alpha/beta hydrolase [Oscillospiraceae bacterium]|nr:alpha/beta hydrolase [Oscillospiraceae bacterium]